MFRIGLGVGRPLPSFGDADAQAFLSAAGITDATQQAAINTLVVDLKGYGIWSKMKAVYPFVGGTASTHKYNLVNPVDSDAAFRLVFNGGWTHSSTGATPNGTNGYADTKLIPNTNLTLNSCSFSVYSRNNVTPGPNNQSFGVSSNGSFIPLIGTTMLTTKGVNSYVYNYLAPDLLVSAVNQNLAAMFLTTRTAANNAKSFRNTTELAAVTTQGQTTQPTTSFTFGAFRNSTSIQDYATFEHAFAHIGNGLTDTEASNFYTAVQAFQTSLNRAIAP